MGYINGQEKIDCLKKAKALLVPIRWDEPFGLTVVEAMLSGTPVIAFERGAMSELIIHGETGFLCKTEEEFSRALFEVDTLDSYKIRQHAIDHFSVSIMARKHIKMLDYAQTHTW